MNEECLAQSVDALGLVWFFVTIAQYRGLATLFLAEMIFRSLMETPEVHFR